MRAMLGVFCAGLAIGVGAILLLLGNSDSDRELPRRDLVATSTMSVELAEQHREKRYEDLDSLQQILALPSRFSQREALYALTGRSNSGDLQGLVFEAARVANDDDRDDALRIVFSRLAEIDPLSGLALSQHTMFGLEPDIESFVWEAWARHDLDDALFEAKTVTSVGRQNRAAQALFIAHGFYDNPTIDRISDELGVRPDQKTRALYLIQLAERSPAEAVEFIDGVASMRDRMLLTNKLAEHMAYRDPATIAEVAGSFRSENERQMFRNMAMQHAVMADPAPVLDNLVRNGRAGLSEEEIMGAVMSIADVDLEAAKRYYSAPGLDRQYRQMLASSISQALVRQDPGEAIEWAKANGSVDGRNLLMFQVLMQVANDDPRRAVDEAKALGTHSQRGELLGQVLGVVARKDPQTAMTYLDELPAGSQKNTAAKSIMSQWMSNDATAAVDWLLSADPDTARRFISESASMVIYQNVDAARRLLPIVPRQHQTNWRYQIVQSLASSGSAQQALEFVDEYKDSREYERLKVQAITAIAQRDPDQAEELSRQLPAGKFRDKTYSSLISIKAQRDPIAAIAMLSEISDERAKGSAAGMLVATWYGHDPVAANNWVDQMPAGLTRDNTIATMMQGWREPTQETARLISSIGDDKLRGRAKVMQIQHLAQTDPEAALALLDDPDIPEKTRKQYRKWIDNNL